MRALSLIIIKLIQKYIKNDKAININNLHRWPSNYDAIAFFLNIISATSARELQNVRSYFFHRLLANVFSIYY